jgi:hypothetical protein
MHLDGGTTIRPGALADGRDTTLPTCLLADRLSKTNAAHHPLSED